MRRARFAVASAHELPEDLPQGEHVLWQGAPGWWALTRFVHLGAVSAYLAVLLAWYAVDRLRGGAPGAWHGLAMMTGLALVPVLVLGAYAFLVARTTSYTLTTRRLVVQVGVALPVSVNIPYACIAAASLRARGGTAGDIAVGLLPGRRLSYVALWPHVRGGRAGSGAEPVLRCLPDAARVGRMLTRLLEASLVPVVEEAWVAPMPVAAAELTEAA